MPAPIGAAQLHRTADPRHRVVGRGTHLGGGRRAHPVLHGFRRLEADGVLGGNIDRFASAQVLGLASLALAPVEGTEAVEAHGTSRSDLFAGNLDHGVKDLSDLSLAVCAGNFGHARKEIALVQIVPRFPVSGHDRIRLMAVSASTNDRRIGQRSLWICA